MAVKNIMIAIATLLLIAGAGTGGYLYGTQAGGESNNAGDVQHAMDLPNFPSVLSFGDNTGTDCVSDLEDGSGSCTFPDGTKQTIEVYDDHLYLQLLEKDADDDEAQCLTIPFPELDLSEAGDDITEHDEDALPLIRPGTQTDRIKSWIIRVPDALNDLLAGSNDGTPAITELEYFEKDGEAWRAEFFEGDSDEPVTIQLGAGSIEDIDVFPDAECMADDDSEEDEHEGRSLTSGAKAGEAIGTAMASGVTGSIMKGACKMGVKTCLGAGAAIAVVVGGAFLISTKCGTEEPSSGGCRRRRLALAAPRMLRSGKATALKSSASLGEAMFQIGGTPVYFDARRMLTSSTVTAMAATAVAGSVVSAAVSSMDTAGPAAVSALVAFQ